MRTGGRPTSIPAAATPCAMAPVAARRNVRLHWPSRCSSACAAQASFLGFQGFTCWQPLPRHTSAALQSYALAKQLQQRLRRMRRPGLADIGVLGFDMLAASGSPHVCGIAELRVVHLMPWASPSTNSQAQCGISAQDRSVHRATCGA